MARSEIGVRNIVAPNDPQGSPFYTKTQADGLATTVEALVCADAEREMSEHCLNQRERLLTRDHKENKLELISGVEVKSITRSQ